MKAKDVAKKLDEYDRLELLAENIESVLSEIEEAEKKEREKTSVTSVTSVTSGMIDCTTTAWPSDITYHQPIFTTISINKEITFLIKDDLKDLLKKRLVEIKDKMDKLEI